MQQSFLLGIFVTSIASITIGMAPDVTTPQTQPSSAQHQAVKPSPFHLPSHQTPSKLNAKAPEWRPRQEPAPILPTFTLNAHARPWIGCILDTNHLDHQDLRSPLTNSFGRTPATVADGQSPDQAYPGMERAKSNSPLFDISTYPTPEEMAQRPLPRPRLDGATCEKLFKTEQAVKALNAILTALMRTINHQEPTGRAEIEASYVAATDSMKTSFQQAVTANQPINAGLVRSEQLLAQIQAQITAQRATLATLIDVVRSEEPAARAEIEASYDAITHRLTTPRNTRIAHGIFKNEQKQALARILHSEESQLAGIQRAARKNLVASRDKQQVRETHIKELRQAEANRLRAHFPGYQPEPVQRCPETGQLFDIDTLKTVRL